MQDVVMSTEESDQTHIEQAARHFTIACKCLMDDKVDDQSRFRDLCAHYRQLEQEPRALKAAQTVSKAFNSDCYNAIAISSNDVQGRRQVAL